MQFRNTFWMLAVLVAMGAADSLDAQRPGAGAAADGTGRVVHHAFGVHLVPALKWAALAMAVGYVVTVTIDAYAWTALGVLFAAGLVISARVAGDR